MYRHNVTDIIVCVYVPAISYDIQQRDNRSRLNGRACRDDVEMNVEHVRTMLLSNPGSVSVDNCDRLSRETKYSKKKQKKKKKKELGITSKQQPLPVHIGVVCTCSNV